jgi:hypothetical protein
MNPLVRITDPEHPHYPETGRFTGEVIRPIWGEEMAKVALDNCRHGTDACFVSPGQIAEIPEPHAPKTQKGKAPMSDSLAVEIQQLRDRMHSAIHGVIAYRQHMTGCEINQTDFCSCGMREAMERLHTAWRAEMLTKLDLLCTTTRPPGGTRGPTIWRAAPRSDAIQRLQDLREVPKRKAPSDDRRQLVRGHRRLRPGR